MARIIEREEWITRPAKSRIEGDADGNVTSWESQCYCSNCNEKINDKGKYCPHCGIEFNGMTKYEELEKVNKESKTKESLKKYPKKRTLEILSSASQLHEDEETADDFMRNDVIKDITTALKKENFIVEEDDFDFSCEYAGYDRDEHMEEYDIELKATFSYYDNGERDASIIKDTVKKIFKNNNMSTTDTRLT